MCLSDDILATSEYFTKYFLSHQSMHSASEELTAIQIDPPPPLPNASPPAQTYEIVSNGVVCLEKFPPTNLHNSAWQQRHGGADGRTTGAGQEVRAGGSEETAHGPPSDARTIPVAQAHPSRTRAL